MATGSSKPSMQAANAEHQHNFKRQHKMKQLATLVLLALLAGCVRNELPTKQSNAKSKVDHLIIKEVFYIGHYWVRDVSKWGFKNTNNNYNDDQYIEIYNPTDQVQYLDNMALCAHAIDPTKVITFAPKDDFVNRYYGVNAISYFPGSGHDLPVQPKQSIIVAKYATDHKAMFEKELEGEDLSLYKGLDAFLDLRKANFEWTNANYDHSGKNNPDVPDLQAIMTHKDKSGNTIPSYEMQEISEHGGLALVRLPWTPEDFAKNYKDTKDKRGYLHYITVTSSAFADFEVIEIPFEYVVDCITICPRSQFQMRPSKLDKGYNAVTDIPFVSLKNSDYPTYSGLALTRRWDGRKFVDDDNTKSDFKVQVASLSRKDDKGNPIK